MKTQNLIFVPRISYGPKVFKYKQNILKLYFNYRKAFVEATFLYIFLRVLEYLSN